MNGWEKLTAAFKHLRAGGMVTRQSFWCCSSCACAALANMVEASPRKDKITGVVYYHRQNTAHAEKTGRIWIHYSSIKAPASKPDDAIGAEVLQAMRDVGLTATWDGNTSTCIEVVVDEALVARIKAEQVARAATAQARTVAAP